MPTIWRVTFDLAALEADFSAASTTARVHLKAWRERVEISQQTIAGDHLLRCDPEHDLWPLPRCVKVRVPDPTTADVKASPWGIVLEGRVDRDGPHLAYVAFGLRHPEAAGSNQPSVYERAHRRLSTQT